MDIFTALKKEAVTLSQHHGSKDIRFFADNVIEFMNDIPKWISVKDRLPEYNIPLLVKFYDGDIQRYIYDPYTITSFEKIISHWMPLSDLKKLPVEGE